MKKRIVTVIGAVVLLFAGCQTQPQAVSKKEVVEEQQKPLSKTRDLEKKLEAEFGKKIVALGGRPTSKNIFYDKSRDLSWQDNEDAREVMRDWSGAKAYCRNLNLGGYSDWRLPDKSELVKLYPKKSNLKNLASGYYWSSSSNVSYSLYAWSVNCKLGYSYDYSKSDKYSVRCARSGQSDTLTFDSFKDYRTYLSYGFINGDNIEKSVFAVEGVKGIEHGVPDKLLYTKDIFPEINRITQRLADLYMKPREFKLRGAPAEIRKPTLPPLPKLTKSQFETKAMFQERVNSAIAKREKEIEAIRLRYREEVEERNRIIEEIKKEEALEIAAIKKEQELKRELLPQKLKEFQKGTFKTVMGTFRLKNPKYDAESGTMYAVMKSSRSSYTKKVALKVPLAAAKSFYSNIEDIEVDAKYEFGDAIVLQSIDGVFNENIYVAKLTEKDFKPEKIEVALEDKKVDFGSAKQNRLVLQNPNLTDTYEVQALAYKEGRAIKGVNYTDDIPTLLKKAKAAKKDPKKWLFVVGIENYDETDRVKFSKRSAELFTKVAQKSLGVTKRNTYALIEKDATAGKLKDKLTLLLSEIKKGDTVYFYYNGHGIPDPKSGGEPYILPKDKIPDFITKESEFKLEEIYNKLSKSKAEKVVAFVDSCFSGSTDGVSVIKGVAASRLAPKKVSFDKRKMAVITAGQKKQYSNMYAERGHRMFSYFVMKSMLKGRKDLKSIFNEVSLKVSDTSNELGPLKKQEPTIDGNIGLKL